MTDMQSDLKATVCIFDVNGVLIDSNLANARAMAEAFTGDLMRQERIAGLYLTLTGIDRGTKIRTIQQRGIRHPLQGEVAIGIVELEIRR
jgi:beta-phosphoglucomutase-like phosphatase (HAD superfamily)